MSSISNKSYKDICTDLKSNREEIRIESYKQISRSPSPVFLSELNSLQNMTMSPKERMFYLQALIKTAKKGSVPILLKFLKHPDHRVKAVAIRGLEQTRATSSNPAAVEALLSQLSLEEPRLVRIILHALSHGLTSEQLTKIVHHFFHPEHPQRSMSSLYVSARLKLPCLKRILEQCLNSTNPSISNYARKALPVLKDKFPEIEELYLRHHSRKKSGTEKPVPETVLDSGTTSEKISLLLNLRDSSSYKKDVIIPLLSNLLKEEKDPFILATAVKTFAEYEPNPSLILPFAHHEDLRVVSNSYEALVKVSPQSVTPLLRDFINEHKLDSPAEARVVMAGLPILANEDEESTVSAFKNMLQGDTSTIAVAIRQLNYLPASATSELNPLMMELFRVQIREDILQPVCKHLSLYAKEEEYGTLYAMNQNLAFCEKKTMLESVLSNIEQRVEHGLLHRMKAAALRKQLPPVISELSQIAYLGESSPKHKEYNTSIWITVAGAALLLFIGILLITQPKNTEMPAPEPTKQESATAQVKESSQTKTPANTQSKSEETKEDINTESKTSTTAAAAKKDIAQSQIVSPVSQASKGMKAEDIPRPVIPEVRSDFFLEPELLETALKQGTTMERLSETLFRGKKTTVAPGIFERTLIYDYNRPRLNVYAPEQEVTVRYQFKMEVPEVLQIRVRYGTFDPQ